MATSSEVKAGLDDVAARIRDSRQKGKTIKAMVTAAKTTLNSIPTDFADVKTTIDAFNATTGTEFEKLAKDELAKLTTEFQALQADFTQAETDLAALAEF